MSTHEERKAAARRRFVRLCHQHGIVAGAPPPTNGMTTEWAAEMLHRVASIIEHMNPKDIETLFDKKA